MKDSGKEFLTYAIMVWVIVIATLLAFALLTKKANAQEYYSGLTINLEKSEPYENVSLLSEEKTESSTIIIQQVNYVPIMVPMPTNHVNLNSLSPMPTFAPWVRDVAWWSGYHIIYPTFCPTQNRLQ